MTKISIKSMSDKELDAFIKRVEEDRYRCQANVVPKTDIVKISQSCANNFSSLEEDEIEFSYRSGLAINEQVSDRV